MMKSAAPHAIAAAAHMNTIQKATFGTRDGVDFGVRNCTCKPLLKRYRLTEKVSPGVTIEKGGTLQLRCRPSISRTPIFVSDTW
jgi:hypothetical protein